MKTAKAYSTEKGKGKREKGEKSSYTLLAETISTPRVVKLSSPIYELTLVSMSLPSRLS